MNLDRNTLRSQTPVQRSESDDLLCMNRSQVTGSIEENVENLRELVGITKTGTSQYVQRYALLKVGEYILKNGPLVKPRMLETSSAP